MANAIYGHGNSAITFQDSGGSAVWTTQNLAAVTGRASTSFDTGVIGTAKPWAYKYLVQCQYNASPIVNEAIRCFLIASEATFADGAVTLNQLLDGIYIPLNSIIVSTVTASTTLTAQGVIPYVPQRYLGFAVYNGSAGAALKNTANINVGTLTPVYDEVQ